MLQLKNGDTVLVRMTVRDDGPMRGQGVVVHEPWEGGTRVVDRNNIVSVEPRPLQVGDNVKTVYAGREYEIRAIDENVALLRQPRIGGYVWEHLANLTRC